MWAMREAYHPKLAGYCWNMFHHFFPATPSSSTGPLLFMRNSYICECWPHPLRSSLYFGTVPSTAIVHKNKARKKLKKWHELIWLLLPLEFQFNCSFGRVQLQSSVHLSIATLLPNSGRTFPLIAALLAGHRPISGNHRWIPIAMTASSESVY